MGQGNDSGTWQTIARVGIVLGIIAAIITVLAFLREVGASTAGAVSVTPTTNQNTVSGNKQPDSTPSPIIAPTAIPTTGPAAPGTILYSANWSSGMNGWTGSSQWAVVNGMLLDNGSGGAGGFNDVATFPPYQPSSPDYSVEARIRLVGDSGVTGEFGLFARMTDDGLSAYSGCVDNIWAQKPYSGQAEIHTGYAEPYPSDILTAHAFTPASDWHIYRLTVKANHIVLYIDGNSVLQTDNNTYLSAGTLGIEAWNGLQVEVSSFQVIAM